MDAKAQRPCRMVSNYLCLLKDSNFEFRAAPPMAEDLRQVSQRTVRRRTVPSKLKLHKPSSVIAAVQAGHDAE